MKNRLFAVVRPGSTELDAGSRTCSLLEEGKGGQGRRKKVEGSPGCVLVKRLEPMAKCYFRIRYVTPAQHHLPAVTLLPVGELG